MARTDPQVNFRLPLPLLERLRESASKHGRTVTAELVARLEASFSPSGDDARLDAIQADIAAIKRAIAKAAAAPKAGKR